MHLILFNFDKQLFNPFLDVFLLNVTINLQLLLMVLFFLEIILQGKKKVLKIYLHFFIQA